MKLVSSKDLEALFISTLFTDKHVFCVWCILYEPCIYVRTQTTLTNESNGQWRVWRQETMGWLHMWTKEVDENNEKPNFNLLIISNYSFVFHILRELGVEVEMHIWGLLTLHGYMINFQSWEKGSLNDWPLNIVRMHYLGTRIVMHGS
jgi:hypothetical protein